MEKMELGLASMSLSGEHNENDNFRGNVCAAPVAIALGALSGMGTVMAGAL